ncbi:MAG: response regulator transcription factor [Gemmiger sp.]|nr:response regulator transcription factor [Gemmiger sp.]
MKRILLLEDDVMIASGLLYALEQEGYEAVHCADVRAAHSALQAGHFDLAILDRQLPDGTGASIGAEIKKMGAATAVIFLTVVDEEGEIVRAFEDGAADYVTKPFRLRELLARIKRTLNAAAGAEGPQFLTIGKARVDPAAGKVLVEGEPVDLTALEYRLLLIFANNPSKLLTRTQILESIWDCGGNFVEDNTLTVYIKRLREKLGDAVQIETVRGMGYRAG